MADHGTTGLAGDEPGSFIGRKSELQQLRRLALGTRALTLCGAGGIGKTRLALRVIAALADRHPDGSWFVDLSDLRRPDLVAARIASVVGVSEEPGRPLLDTLADALAPRRVLLGLDGCEHLIESCARVCQRLLASAPGLRVLATSREPLRVAAETVWPVPPMSLPEAQPRPAQPRPAQPRSAQSRPAQSRPALAGRQQSDAIALFAARAAAACPDFALTPANAAAITAICRALDGLPLAIELAAAQVPVLSAEQIAARLGDRFQLLVTADPAAPPRQRTMRGAIDWSHELLTGAERMLLRRLSVFAGWSLEMAEQVCAGDGLPRQLILNLLAALVDKSFVVLDGEVLGEARYRLLDSIRDYGALQLAQAGETMVTQRRLRDYTLATVERLGHAGMARTPASWADRVSAFRRFDIEIGNLRLVLARCLADRDAQPGLRICLATLPVWIVRGRFAEGIEWFDSFLSLDPAGLPAAARGPAMIGRAQLSLASDPADARKLAADGLELCQAAGERFWSAAALNLLTEVALHAGQIEQAAATADRALAVARAAGDRWNEGYALGTRAAAAGRRGDLAQAKEDAEAALSIMRQIDQQWGAARTLLGLADLARLTGDHDRALDRYRQALAILRMVDARPQVARCLAGLGHLALEAGDLALARQHLAESLELSTAIGSRIGMLRGVEAFAALAIGEGSGRRAVLLAAAAAAGRERAVLAAPAARARQVEAAAGLSAAAVTRLRAEGAALDLDTAIALALAAPDLAATQALAGPGTDSYRAGRGAGAAGDALTPRERQIAAIIATGSTNKQIAAQLSISPGTVARHVASILRRLGFTSRVQIATWVRRGGPEHRGISRPGAPPGTGR